MSSRTRPWPVPDAPWELPASAGARGSLLVTRLRARSSTTQGIRGAGRSSPCRWEDGCHQAPCPRYRHQHGGSVSSLTLLLFLRGKAKS